MALLSSIYLQRCPSLDGRLTRFTLQVLHSPWKDTLELAVGQGVEAALVAAASEADQSNIRFKVTLKQFMAGRHGQVVGCSTQNQETEGSNHGHVIVVWAFFFLLPSLPSSDGTFTSNLVIASCLCTEREYREAKNKS